MLVKKAPDIRSSEITDEKLYFARREFMRTVSGAAIGAFAAAHLLDDTLAAQTPLPNLRKSPFSTDEKQNDFEDIVAYNNFYEFGMDKTDPAKYASSLKTKPWSVAVEGLCAKPAVYNLEDILGPHPLEERIYRIRCVEAWSMVVSWVGFPLGDLLKRFEPAPSAKFVEFSTLLRPSEMRGQRQHLLNFPYIEGLRMDEAMHPLTILAVGLYGKTLLNQSGAPLRLVVPWKYGFKSIKTIDKIKFVDKAPLNTWQAMARNEYGFYSNVNPNVDHPRWSQSVERRIGEFFRRKTLMFNGYDQVASLYSGMDLKKNF